MKSVLVHGGLWRMVSGSVKRESATNDEERAKWDADDGKALASIILSVKPTQLGYIKNCKISSEAWQKLQATYQPKGPIQKVCLYKRLISLQMKESSSVMLHIKSFSETIEKLAETGIEMQEELLTIMLLCSLSKDFENFVVAMETRDTLPSLNFLKQKLLEEADRRKEKVDEGETSSQQEVFNVRSTQQKRQTNNKKPFKGKCYNCGVTGHFASQCEKKKKKQQPQALSIVAAAEQKIMKSVWYMDSGATAHMCNDRNMFIRFEDHNEQIALAGNKFITATGKGDVYLKFDNIDITLENVLYSCELQGNFISVTRIVDRGLTVKFQANMATVRRPDGSVVLRARRENNLFVVQSSTEAAFAMPSKADVWHTRFGHLNYASLNELCKAGILKGVCIGGYNNPCRTCMMCKVHVQPFPKESEHVSSKLLELVHSHVCGPFRTQSLGGSKYFITFIDDKSRRIFVYFMKAKSEALDKFKLFKQHVENETGNKIVILRTDNGREYVNNEFETFLQQQGIQRQLTVPYTPQQNGVAERCNRTLVEMARSMLFHSTVQQNLWAEAVNTAVYIRNRCPTKATNNITPFEVWYGRQPSVKHLRTFGSYVVALNKGKQMSKFEPKGEEFVMVGYSTVAKAYRLFDKKTHKIVEQRDVRFDETVFNNNSNNRMKVDDQQQNSVNFEDYLILCTENVKTVDDATNVSETPKVENIDINSEDDEEVNNNDVEEFNTADEDSQPENKYDDQKPKIIGKGRPKIIRNNKPGRPRKMYNEVNCMVEVKIPQTLEEAVSCEERDSWEKAMRAEISSLEMNNTWSLEELHNGHKPISCKWVYAVKRDRQGNIERYKARLVAKGCSQRYGIDYLETFSPVVRYSTIRILLALAVEWKMYLHQIDVSTAYLNSELHDEIYIRQPPGFQDKNNLNGVLRLNKAIYGLKQSGREWNSKLNAVLKSIGFQPTESDPCLYKCVVDNNLVLIAVYVDDLIIGCKSKEVVLDIKMKLCNEFDVTDKGTLHHFLGMEIDRQEETGAIRLGQTQYIKDMLKKFGMDNCNSVSIPLDAGYQSQCAENCKKVDKQEYQTIIGTLMYLAITTRPDILHSISKLA